MRPALRLIASNFESGSGPSGTPGAKPTNGHDHKTTILVVEDDVLIRIAAAEALRHANYRVLEAATGDEAKILMESQEPIEVVFSDVNMPGKLNGFQLARWIRKEYPDVEVLLTSGVSDMAKPGYGAEHGPVLQKPYDMDALVAHIKRILRG